MRCSGAGRREARADFLGWTKGERSVERARRRGTEGRAGGRTNGSQGEQDEENGRPKTSRTARVPRRREKREGRRTTRDRDRTFAHGPVLLLAFGTMAEFVETSGDMCERALCPNRSRNRRQGTGDRGNTGLGGRRLSPRQGSDIEDDWKRERIVEGRPGWVSAAQDIEIGAGGRRRAR